mgnify:CR=1 FL=1
MKNKKQKSKKITLDGLAGLVKQGFKRNQKEMAEMTVMVKNAFQGNQDYMDLKFNAIDEKFEKIDRRFDQVDENFKQVTQKINNISLNAVDVVRVEDLEKLDNRVIVLEEKMVDLPAKKG